MDGCANDILAPLILAVMVAHGHPLTLDEIADGVSEVIYSQCLSEEMLELIGDAKHERKRLPQKSS
ncbi:hypothetical protein KR054_001281 [Drosophila jambulina]|nr:hypothetical protein KR054_001281 [Drosophila jambulina]